MARVLGVFINNVDPHKLLLAVHGLFFATIVLTNNSAYPRTIYLLLVLPIALVVALHFARHVFISSTIFWAVGAYLLALGLSSLAELDVPRNELSRHFRLIPLILSYLTVVGFLANLPNALRHLMLICCVLLSISAAINITGFIFRWPLPEPFAMSYDRLVSALGMPGYNNSTNISAPYAIYGIGAVAALARGDLDRFERILFSVSAAVLFLGLLLTQSRGGYAGAALGLLTVGFAKPQLRRFILLSAVTVGAFLMAFPYFTDILLARGLSYRPELWASYLSMALERPFQGYGILDNINQIMRDGHVVIQPHNIVLSAFVRGGVWGALAMIGILTSSIFWATRHLRKTRDIIPLGLVTTMIGCAMFDYQLLATYPTWPWITFWLPIGVCVGVETKLRRAEAALSSD